MLQNICFNTNIFHFLITRMADFYRNVLIFAKELYNLFYYSSNRIGRIVSSQWIDRCGGSFRRRGHNWTIHPLGEKGRRGYCRDEEGEILVKMFM